MEKATTTEIAELIRATGGTAHAQTARKMLHELNVVNLKNTHLVLAVQKLRAAAKAMPEHSYTPAQMALDDAIEAAEEVMKEVE